ncbi:MAG TPA: signal recognition particle-docking protein FtsY [Acidimicrobiales bacterium]|nr:signal recognition particle-docking protein FtsY [Acidimicrobiales bacterium]
MVWEIVVAVVVVVLAGGGLGGALVVSRRRAARALEHPPAGLPQGPARRPPAAGRAGPPVPEVPGEASAEPSGPPVAEPVLGAVAEPVVGAVGEPVGGATSDVVADAAPLILERPRFRDRLGKARNLLASHLAGLRGRSKLDEQTWEELEEALILADLGVATVGSLLASLQDLARKDGLRGPEQLVGALRQQMVALLAGDRELHRATGATTVWLFVGVNGVGKTTTIGKVGMREKAEGRSVVMAAGDTFRAAAADQLQLWSERVGANFVRGNEGGDPGAVVFDAVQHASARGIPLVLADTAGRLHTKINLMEELKKVRRVADRPPGSVTEVLLVIDATTGQNGLVQARQFTEAVGVTGVVLTKLDGTAKGGIALAITSELGIPIKLVGLGEGPEDLVPFDAEEFVDALLPAE